MSENKDSEKNYVTLSVDIPYSLKDQLKFRSYTDKKPIKDIVKEALDKYFNDESVK